jgi:hypothetical protein
LTNEMDCLRSNKSTTSDIQLNEVALELRQIISSLLSDDNTTRASIGKPMLSVNKGK